MERFGRIDVLVNNAAIYYELDRSETTLAYFNRVLSVNLTGAWLMTRAVERHMKRQRQAARSSTSRRPPPTSATSGSSTPSDPDQPLPPFHYSVAKIGVTGLTKYMAGALGPWGINVNAIAPGVTMTEATKTIVPRRCRHRSSCSARCEGARARGPDRHRRVPRLRRQRHDDGAGRWSSTAA